MRSHLRDNLWNCFAEDHHFIGDIEDVLHAVIHRTDVKIGGDGVREISCFDDGGRYGPCEGASAVAYIAVDSAFSHDEKCFGSEAGFRILLATQAGEAVGVDVAGTKVRGDEFKERALDAARTVVDHDGDVGYVAGDDRLVIR